MTTWKEVLAERALRTAREQAFRDTVDGTHPMGAARLVRRDKYAWPGGYPLALVLQDGGLLCPDCVTEEYSQISWAHRHHLRGDWTPAGFAILYESPDGDTMCANCDKPILEQDD